MRQDLAKVICEDGRRGPREDLGRQNKFDSMHQPKRASYEDHEDEYSHLENLPSQESLRARIRNNWGDMRRFSENLGALRGLIHKNLGQDWDKFYSDLCALVPRVGSNIQYHVHQHLNDFIEFESKMVDGVIHFRDRMDGWIPFKRYINSYLYRQYDFFYYVDPATRKICRIKLQKRAEKVLDKTFIKKDGLFYCKMDGLWWELKVREQKTFKVRDYDFRLKMVVYTDRVENDKFWDRIHALPYVRAMSHHGMPLKDALFGKNMMVDSRRQISGQELKKLGVKND